MTGPAIAFLDIETMPALADVFSLFDKYIPIERVREPGYVFGFGWKWHGDRSVAWCQGDEVATFAYNVLDTADIVVTYNGDRFDLPHLNTAILKAGGTPPSPYKSVDLYKTVKRRLNLESNKLDYVARTLGLPVKHKTDYALWRACMDGDERAWARMARYCKQDVRITEKVHDRILPWISNYPNVNLWTDGESPACVRCGSRKLTKQGLRHTITVSYQQYKCTDCGAWSRGTDIERRASGGTRAA